MNRWKSLTRELLFHGDEKIIDRQNLIVVNILHKKSHLKKLRSDINAKLELREND
jgi:hypothetical protein